MARAPKLTTIQQSGFISGQNREYTHVLRVDGQVLRVVIRHDTSCPSQSYAKVEFWTPTGWSFVTGLHFAEVTTTADYVNGVKALPASAFAANENTLLGFAYAVLNIGTGAAAK